MKRSKLLEEIKGMLERATDKEIDIVWHFLRGMIRAKK